VAVPKPYKYFPIHDIPHTNDTEFWLVIVGAVFYSTSGHLGVEDQTPVFVDDITMTTTTGIFVGLLKKLLVPPGHTLNGNFVSAAQAIQCSTLEAALTIL